MNYAQRIKDIREDNDYTQAQIAEILKTERGYYNKYENGKHPLPINHLITLCEFYNLSADYLLGIIDEPRPLH